MVAARFIDMGHKPFAHAARGERKGPRAVMVAMQGQTDLLQVALALHAYRCQTDALHGGNQQADEHCQDGDDHQ